MRIFVFYRVELRSLDSTLLCTEKCFANAVSQPPNYLVIPGASQTITMNDENDTSIDPLSFSQSNFPQNPEEFDADPRVSFSKLDNKFILEIDEDHEFEYDDALKRWVPVVCPPHPLAAEGATILL